MSPVGAGPAGAGTETVAQQVGRLLAAEGIRQVFGVVGSGNFVVTNALRAHGASYVAARHETGATVMADVHARTTGEVAAVSLHQGCGYSNAVTGIAEAAKSHTPLLVLTAETPASQPLANFAVDQAALAGAVGAEFVRLDSTATAGADAVRAYRRARDERRTVVLSMPLDVQTAIAPTLARGTRATTRSRPCATPDAVTDLATRLGHAQRPVFLCGRGAREAGPALRELARRTGALLLTSAVARGLVEDDAWHVGCMGGFGTPLSQELVRDSDLLVVWGASLNRWTSLDGALLSRTTTVHVDDVEHAIGLHHPVDVGIVGDVDRTARAVLHEIGDVEHQGYRAEDVAHRLKAEGRWRDVPYEDNSTETTVDPRTLTFALDDLLPAERAVVTDVGNFSGWPAMFLSVPDPAGYCLPLAFQCVGLGLAAGVGSAVAQPHRVVVCGVGDGGFHMGLAELETAVRLRLRLLVVVYDDQAYGAEVHHFAGTAPGGAAGVDLGTVTFPPTDIAAIARGLGAAAVTVKSLEDLGAIADWLDSGTPGPLVAHARISPTPSWMLAHAFAGETGRVGTSAPD
ncbi:thiamine pyrophosphate-binding protein [Nocardioides nanhaiensis]|uniref:Thiamine pyrophosphate-binding protein n=1 Tax=Nocardioides nanhaiensis TaxID=1476871 RepID=A0ABP8WAH8_9ACTN